MSRAPYGFSLHVCIFPRGSLKLGSFHSIPDAFRHVLYVSTLGPGFDCRISYSVHDIECVPISLSSIFGVPALIL